jgi:hypothetical protein
MTCSHIALAGTIAALLIPATIHAQTRKTPAPVVDGPDFSDKWKSPLEISEDYGVFED